MELKVNSNAFIKLPDLLKVSTAKVIIDDFSLVKNEIKGNVIIKGDYYKSDEETSINDFFESIPFSVVFSHNENEFKDIRVSNLEYFEVEDKGIETSFDLFVEYDKKELILDEKDDDVQIPEERLAETIIEKEDVKETLEDIKTSISNKMDKMLSSKIEVKEDNLPTKRINNTNKKTIKICFFKHESEIDEICSSNNVTVDTVLKDSNNSEYISKQRLFIK